MTQPVKTICGVCGNPEAATSTMAEHSAEFEHDFVPVEVTQPETTDAEKLETELHKQCYYFHPTAPENHREQSCPFYEAAATISDLRAEVKRLRPMVGDPCHEHRQRIKKLEVWLASARGTFIQLVNRAKKAEAELEAALKDNGLDVGLLLKPAHERAMRYETALRDIEGLDYAPGGIMHQAGQALGLLQSAKEIAKRALEADLISRAEAIRECSCGLDDAIAAEKTLTTDTNKEEQG